MKTKPNLDALQAALAKLPEIDKSGIIKGTRTAADIVAEALPMIKDALTRGYTVNNIVEFLMKSGAGVSEPTLKTHINRALSNKSVKPRKLRGDLNIQNVRRIEPNERAE